jgi:hypothetical protein
MESLNRSGGETFRDDCSSGYQFTIESVIRSIGPLTTALRRSPLSHDRQVSVFTHNQAHRRAASVTELDKV